MRDYVIILLMVLSSSFIFSHGLSAQDTATTDEPAKLIKASLRTDQHIVQAGQEVWVEFLLTNLASESLSLIVPDTASVIYDNLTADTGQNPLQMGLPLAHVFSGQGHTAVTIENDKNIKFSTNVSIKHKGPVPEVILAPHASVGLRVELTRYYDSLLRPSVYTLVWRPYNGAIESAPLTINILADKQAVLLTDHGKISMRFYYDKAPNHVNNFIELVQQRFYDELAFHRVVPGGLIQGGCPRGDGYGIRKDEKRVKAEFSDILFKLGTVGMARSPSDPDSASCQFFITLNRQPTFDRKQTAFGYVVGDESFETLQKIASLPTDSTKRPIKPVYFRSISLENVLSREHPSPGGQSNKDTGQGRIKPAISLSKRKPGTDFSTADPSAVRKVAATTQTAN